MEEAIKIQRIKLDLKSYIKMSFVLGLCLGILGVFLNLGLDLFFLIFGSAEADLSARLSALFFGLPSTFSSLLISPVSMMIVGVITYPIYNYISNHFFGLSISGHGEVEH